MLRPGGRLCIGDWLRGEGDALDPDVDAFVESAGEGFHMQEVARLREPTDGTPISQLGTELLEASIRFWEVLVTSTALGVLRPGHVRASKDRTRGSQPPSPFR